MCAQSLTLVGWAPEEHSICRNLFSRRDQKYHSRVRRFPHLPPPTPEGHPSKRKTYCPPAPPPPSPCSLVQFIRNPWKHQGTFQTQAQMTHSCSTSSLEAATWAFISEVLNSGRTHRLYLKLMGLDYGRMRSNEMRTHLCGVWPPSPLLCIVSQLAVAGWHCHIIPRAKH